MLARVVLGGCALSRHTSLMAMTSLPSRDCPHSSLSSSQFRFRSSHSPSNYHATTILSVRKNNEVVIVGDGQVTHGDVVLKPNARKVRRIGNTIVAGFAGVTADALCLFELLEQKLEAYPDQLLRACVEMAKAWRTGRELRRLEATMIVANHDISLTITGIGDVVQPHDGVIAIGSGGNYALAAARALLAIENEMSAEEIAMLSMKIAADMCIYTNGNFVVEKLTKDNKPTLPQNDLTQTQLEPQNDKGINEDKKENK